MREIL
jgi:hypothetical protein